MKKKNKYLGLPGETKVEVVFTRLESQPLLKECSYAEALSIKAKKGWKKKIFKLGYSSFKNVKKI